MLDIAHALSTLAGCDSREGRWWAVPVSGGVPVIPTHRVARPHPHAGCAGAPRVGSMEPWTQVSATASLRPGGARCGGGRVSLCGPPQNAARTSLASLLTRA